MLELPALRSGVIAPSVAGALTGRQSADDLVFRDSGDVVARAPEGVSAAGSIAAGISAAARRGESWAQSERHTEVCAGPQDSDEAASRLHHGADLAAEIIFEKAPKDSFSIEEIRDVAVVCGVAKGNKCNRSWKVLPEVGTDREYPDLSLRDAAVMREINAKNT